MYIDRNEPARTAARRPRPFKMFGNSRRKHFNRPEHGQYRSLNHSTPFSLKLTKKYWIGVAFFVVITGAVVGGLAGGGIFSSSDSSSEDVQDSGASSTPQAASSSTAVGDTVASSSGSVAPTSAPSVQTSYFREAAGALSPTVDIQGYLWHPMPCQSWENCVGFEAMDYTMARQTTMNQFLYSGHLLSTNIYLRKNYTVDNGSYNIQLHMCTIVADSQRNFDVQVNGVVVVSAIKMVPLCSATPTGAMIQTVSNVLVTTGQISIFLSGQHSIISGVVIDSSFSPTPPSGTATQKSNIHLTYGLESGDYLASDGTEWYPMNRGTYELVSGTHPEIPQNQVDPTIYQTLIYSSSFIFNFPVIRGSYKVAPIFCDVTLTPARTMNVTINGQRVLTDFAPTPSSDVSDRGKITETQFGPYSGVDAITLTIESALDQEILNGVSIIGV